MFSSNTLSRHYFILGTISLCSAYLLFELFFNAYTNFSVDEFWFAHRIYQYKNSLPYRDFAPYKTVLGYYLLLIPMLFSHGIIDTLIFIKNTIALLNTAVLLGSALWLSRFFSRSAILASLCLLILSELVLSYSTNIRVDLLGYWFCFFSLLLLLEKRYLTAGLLLGLGFITTQKALWYLLASNGALGIYWLVAARNLKFIGNIIRFNLITAAVILFYMLIWAAVADWHTVMHSIFYEASVMYHLDWYNNTRIFFWSLILFYNPLLFLLWPLTLVSVLISYDQDYSCHHRLMVIIYAFILLICLIQYKQVFPYYMQITIPLFFVLYAAFFTWLFGIFKPYTSLKIIIGKNGLWAFLWLYLTLIVSLIILLSLPESYLLICFIPLLLGFYITHKDNLSADLDRLFRHLIAICIVFMGGVYTLTLFTMKMMSIEGSYQKANINTINTLLQDGSDYVAGIELIYNKTQPIAGLRHLMGPAVDYLYMPTEKLRPVMLDSLYEDPNATVATITKALKTSSVKFYVNNYRIHALPAILLQYLASEYEHYWGSIYLYAPQISAGQKKLTIKFTGKYLIETRYTDSILLDGKRYNVNSIIYLNKGTHLSKAKKAYRLKLLPEQSRSLFDPQFQQDDLDKILW